jgi:hypothetical protein
VLRQVLHLHLRYCFCTPLRDWVFKRYFGRGLSLMI